MIGWGHRAQCTSHRFRFSKHNTINNKCMEHHHVIPTHITMYNKHQEAHIVLPNYQLLGHLIFTTLPHPWMSPSLGILHQWGNPFLLLLLPLLVLLLSSLLYFNLLFHPLNYVYISYHIPYIPRMHKDISAGVREREKERSTLHTERHLLWIMMHYI